MKTFLIALTFISSLSVFSTTFAATDANIAKVKKLTTTYVGGKDVKISVSKIDTPLCGAVGPTYVALVSVRQYERYLNASDQVDLRSVWQKIKTYGITEASLKAGETTLMASEQCLE